jgi:hypothetical protein
MSVHMTLEQALAWLPDDADGIAVVIYAAGIRGDHSCRTCPLAQLLSLMTGEAVAVDKVVAYVPSASWRSVRTLPSAARGFVANFDGIWSPLNCAYPELEAA